MSAVKIFVPRDSAALAVGADEVAAALSQQTMSISAVLGHRVDRSLCVRVFFFSKQKTAYEI